MPDEPAKPRRKHYIAIPRGNFRMTERVKLITSLLASFRLLRTGHILECLRYYLGDNNSDQRTVRLLRTLHDHKHVLRIQNDPDSASIAHGSLEKIYCLPHRRNQCLNERRETASKVIPHALAVADTTIFNVIRPCRESRGALRFIDHEEILATMAPEHTRQLQKPLSWSVRVHHQAAWQTVGITSDRLFIVKSESGRLAFLLEEDMQSEPIQRKNLQGTAIYRKLLAYGFTHTNRLLLERFGIPGFRVLFVTNSTKRAEHMLAAYELVNGELKAAGLRTCPANVFLFIDRPTLREGDIFTVPWINGRGDTVTIDLPPAAAP
jgi:hypothetical protein